MRSLPTTVRLAAVAAAASIGVAGLLPAAQAGPSTPQAEGSKKNVIVIIGDGMGYNHVDAASLWEHGTAAYQSSEDNPYLAADGGPSVASQPYQQYPVQLGQDTGYIFSPDYAEIDPWASPRHVTRQSPAGEVNVTDSGAAATALSTGQRTRGGHLGMDRDMNPLEDMVEVASDRGMATGVVTDARFWADTPAGFAVHADDGETESIIDQMLYHEDLDVVMGGGHPEFTNTGEPKTAYHKYVPKAEWDALNGGAPVEGLPAWTLADSRAEIQALAEAEDTPERVLGLAPTDGALFHDRPGEADTPFAAPMSEDIPRLEELAIANYNVLDNASDTGFFTVVEAATIDSASHHGQLGRAIEGVQALNDTVEATNAWVEEHSNWEETTVIVTSDHETGNLWGAGTDDSGRFQPLTGTAGDVPAAEFTDFTDADPADPEKAPHYHTLALVPLYAKGPLADDLQKVATGADPVRGAYLRNTDIADVIHADMEKLPAQVAIEGVMEGEKLAEKSNKTITVTVADPSVGEVTARLLDEDGNRVIDDHVATLHDGRAEITFRVPALAGSTLTLEVVAGTDTDSVHVEIMAPYEAPRPPFTDVPFGIEHYEAMAWMKDRGYSKGWPDGTYRPTTAVNRDAMAAFLYRLAGAPEVDLPETSPFTDVKPTDEHYTAIVWASQQGIAEGWEDGTFRPRTPIARDAMAAFVHRYAGSPKIDAPEKSPFDDVDTDDQFYAEMAWMYEKGLAKGWSDGTYRPLKATNRDATAAFLFRMDHEQNIIWQPRQD